MANETQDDRTQRGHRAVELHPDLGPHGIDFETAASDLIADILHAAEEAGVLPSEMEALVERALRTYHADAEDAS